MSYRGRIAPSPTGLMHMGHARTFWIAQERARAAGGRLVYRNEDLDRARCKPEFVRAALEDLHAIGLRWDEGPDIGGPHAPYNQSERGALYRAAWARLHASGCIYPCNKSRQDVERALTAPHADEPIFPPELRTPVEAGAAAREPGATNWRFRTPDGATLTFVDGRAGEQRFTAGVHFGDFLVWRKDGFPSYELAVVADDSAMQITEVVRGEDLLLSTARQLLLYRALGATPPAFYHCELLYDETGRRLAKRSAALSIRTLLSGDVPAAELRARYGF